MSLCRLLVLDYSHRIGRFDEQTGAERYDDADRAFGAGYARGLIEEDYSVEPFLGIDLADFADWCDSEGHN